MSITEPSRPSAVPSDESVREAASSMALAERPRRRHYQYEPLRNPNSDIRVLKLLPSSEPGELHCNLETCSLDDKPFYVAVSYEWGEPEPLVDIRVNGKPFRIRHNLWLFLNYLQNNKADLVRDDLFRLWADAICIDQTNLTEKGTQVQIMSRIFKEADSVFAWLGYTTRLNTQLIFRFIKEASCLGQSNFPNPDSEYRRWSQEFVLMEITSRHVYYGSLLEIWKGILQLSRVSYWSRRWIIQELLISREITLLLDGEELPWSAITAVFEILDWGGCPPTSEELAAVLSELQQTIPWKIWSHRTRVGPARIHINSLGPLLDLLQDFRQTFCTVTYDKVYAFLGLVDKGNSVKVDYGCSMIELFCKVVSIGGTAMLRANFIGDLATELGLSSELNEKHMPEPKGVRPFVTYSAKLSELVRIVHVDLGEDSLFGFLDTDKFGQYRPTISIRGETIGDAKYLAKEHQIFDTNLIDSRVKQDSRYKVSLRNKKAEMSNCKEGSGILNLDRIPSSPSSSLTESLKFTYVVLEDESLALSCSSTLPGDFLCPLGQRKWLVLRNHGGLFAIVGTASVVMSKSDVPKIFSARYCSDGIYAKYKLHLQRYNALQESLRKGSFAYTWTKQRNPIMKAPGESNEDAFDKEGGRVQVWQPASANSRMLAATAHDQAVGVEASLTPETLSTSSIDILFDGWELVQHAPKWEYLENLHAIP